METQDYWIRDNILIFKPKFNKPINNNLIHNYNQIIFSNYIDPLIAIKINNKYCQKFEKYWEGNKFKKSFKPHRNITHLTFGFMFNKPLKLNNSLTHLTFG